jgi:hypothetical protein
VAQAANGTSTRAQESEKAAQDLASVAAELGKLMAQFKIERRERRTKISLPIRLSATDINGRPLDQEVTTIDVSQQGALLTGIRGKLRMGEQISLARLQKREQFLIAWIGKEDTPKASQIGVSALDSGSTFWSDVLEAQSPDKAEIPGKSDFETVPKPRARAHGA